MKKKSGKGKARAIKDLPVSDAKARQSKGAKASPVLTTASGQHFKSAIITT